MASASTAGPRAAVPTLKSSAASPVSGVLVLALRACLALFMAWMGMLGSPGWSLRSRDSFLVVVRSLAAVARPRRGGGRCWFSSRSGGGK